MTPEQLLSHYDQGLDWPAGCGLDVPAAYQRALAVRDLRIARGERPRGYKVGFTNRNIWPRYGVYGPVWGPVWDTTLTFCEGDGELSLDRTAHPRIEPEAVFGIARTPPPGADLQALLESLEWVAPGFEIVQSHQAWKTAAADAVADGALHARLLVGRRVPVGAIAQDALAFEQQLAAARTRLFEGGSLKEEGAGSNVLDGPLHALQHFLQALRQTPGATDLQPGDVVSTGTWTDAWPVAPGEVWRAEFDSPLSALAVRLR
jgi:2-oxo-3-hexenedioate decarboxylase